MGTRVEGQVYIAMIVRMNRETRHSSQGLMLTAEDLRQFTYCNRILYFRHVMRANVPRTYNMKRGEREHERLARKKRLETTSGGTEKYYNVYLESRMLQLRAVLDCMEFDGTSIVPIELKSGKAPVQGPFEHHVVQLVAEALLLEACHGMIVDHGKLVYTDHQIEVNHPITLEWKQRVIELATRARRIITEEILPRPTRDAGKCKSCEFWLRCLSV